MPGLSEGAGGEGMAVKANGEIVGFVVGPRTYATLINPPSGHSAGGFKYLHHGGDKHR